MLGIFTNVRNISILATLVACVLLARAEPSAQTSVDEPVRTADVNVRGLARSDFPRVHQLAENVYVYAGLQLRTDIEMEFATNNLVVITSEGVLVADGQINEADTRQLMSSIAMLTPQPVTHVVVGSDHNDHVGGNAAFPSGTTFIAHPTSAAVIQQRNADAALSGSPARIPVPTELVADQMTLRLGGTEIQILFLGRAHTGGDLAVYLPVENILFLSEAYFNRLFPSLYGGYPTEWVETLKAAEAMNASVYVPGHGFIDSPRVLREELVLFREALETVVSEGYRLRAAGVPIQRAPRGVILGQFGYWTRAAQNLPDALARVYLEAAGDLP